MIDVGFPGWVNDGDQVVPPGHVVVPPGHVVVPLERIERLQNQIVYLRMLSGCDEYGVPVDFDDEPLPGSTDSGSFTEWDTIWPIRQKLRRYFQTRR